jgi:hypothetical protein
MRSIDGEEKMLPTATATRAQAVPHVVEEDRQVARAAAAHDAIILTGRLNSALPSPASGGSVAGIAAIVSGGT